MKKKDIERIVHRSPFEPFRIMLDDGEQVYVTKPRKAHVSGEQIACVGETHKGTEVTSERLRFINVKRVVTVESI